MITGDAQQVADAVGIDLGVDATYAVNGMTCGHCVAAVSNGLEALPAVSDVDVDLDAGTVTVTSDQPLDAAAVRAAVDEAGYDLVE